MDLLGLWIYRYILVYTQAMTSIPEWRERMQNFGADKEITINTLDGELVLFYSGDIDETDIEALEKCTKDELTNALMEKGFESHHVTDTH